MSPASCTLVIGASENVERYSNKAIKALLAHNIPVQALASRKGTVDTVNFALEASDVSLPIDTITIYINPALQVKYEQFILYVKPRRVIFNPGTENENFAAKLVEHGIMAQEACTLVLLSIGSY
jgi:uncharacterized protein